MTRLFSALAAFGITASLVAIYAAGAYAAQPGPVRTISATAGGKPILLKRMVVTAAALPDTSIN